MQSESRDATVADDTRPETTSTTTRTETDMTAATATKKKGKKSKGAKGGHAAAPRATTKREPTKRQKVKAASDAEWAARARKLEESERGGPKSRDGSNNDKLYALFEKGVADKKLPGEMYDQAEKLGILRHSARRAFSIWSRMKAGKKVPDAPAPVEAGA